MSKIPLNDRNLQSLDEVSLKDFKLLDVLGDGAFGEVWRCRHRASGLYFAIKLVAKSKVAKMSAQFQREISIMHMITHPNIIKLYKHFEDAETYYLVMELADNGTLRDKISQIYPLQEPEIKKIFFETLQAVYYLHSHVPPIIHRDIKPENIMFDNDFHVKLCDFGFSNYYDQERKTSCGTLEYLPPEIVERKSHDTSVDIWSLGVLLYEMFIGFTPFTDGSNEKVLMNIANLKVKCPINIPPLAKDLISLMLDRDYVRRFTAREILDHGWIRDMGEPKAIKTETLKSGVILTNPAMLLTPSPKDISNSIVFSFRKSINSMKSQILTKTHGTKNTKSLVTMHRDLLSTNTQVLKELEKRLEEQKVKFTEVVSREKLLSSRLKDLDYDIARIVNVCEAGVVKQKVLELREDVGSKVKECEIQKEILKNLRQQVKIMAIAMIEKEEELRDLSKNLGKIREEAVKNDKETEIQVGELAEYLGLLKQKLQCSTNAVPLVGIDQQVSEEIVGFVSNYMDSCSEDLVFSIRRLLVATENKGRTIEKRFSSLKLEYTEERENIIMEIKRKKDRFLSELRKRQHKELYDKVEENMEKERGARSVVEQARIKENEVSAEMIDIAIARNRLYALKKDIQECEYKIMKNKMHRTEMAKVIRKKIKKLEKFKTCISIL